MPMCGEYKYHDNIGIHTILALLGYVDWREFEH